jgi:hypothetical protein
MWSKLPLDIRAYRREAALLLRGRLRGTPLHILCHSNRGQACCRGLSRLLLLAPRAPDSAGGVAGTRFAQWYLTCMGAEGVSHSDSTTRGTCGRVCLDDASWPYCHCHIRQARAGHEHDGSAMDAGAGRAAARAHPPRSGTKPYKREGHRLLPLNPMECAFFIQFCHQNYRYRELAEICQTNEYIKVCMIRR